MHQYASHVKNYYFDKFCRPLNPYSPFDLMRYCLANFDYKFGYDSKIDGKQKAKG